VQPVPGRAGRRALGGRLLGREAGFLAIEGHSRKGGSSDRRGGRRRSEQARAGASRPLHAMEFDSIDDIKQSGFRGFVPISALQASKCRQVPDEPGVYLVLRPGKTRPAFLSQSIGGHFKGKDPTVAVAELAGGLVVCWKTTPNADPRTVEKGLIEEFEATYGKRPFANLRG